MDAQQWAQQLAADTPAWTGADLSGLLRSAASFALQRSIEESEQKSVALDRGGKANGIEMGGKRDGEGEVCCSLYVYLRVRVSGLR